MEILKKISDCINKVFGVLAELCFIGFILSMLLQVTLRNLFPMHAVSWADSLCRYLFIWGFYLAGVVVVSKGKNITITLLPDALRGTTKKALALLNNSIFFIVLIFITSNSFRVVNAVSRRRLDVFPVSAAWLYAALPVFGVFAAFQLIVKTIEDVKKAEGVNGR